MNSSDSAEAIVKLSLEGMEVALKIAGTGAKNIAIMLYTIMKDNQQTKGKTRLTNMLKTGKPLKIFTIRAEDLKKFSQEAKKYGVLYCALADRKNSKIDGMVDIMVRDEDASKMNRIAQRFKFRDVASIERDLEKEKQEKNKKELEKNTEQPKSEEEQFIEDIMPVSKEEIKQEIPSNDTKETEEKNLSEISSNTRLGDKVENINEEKKSVKVELKEIEQEIKEKEKIKEQQEIVVETPKEKKKEPKHLKEDNKTKKGKRYKEPKHLATTKKKKSKKRERSK
ncbi:MAG: PcfB family protein [Clostridia bacterium]|nr:PcfB family protein [Clostridia bacterium]